VNGQPVWIGKLQQAPRATGIEQAAGGRHECGRARRRRPLRAAPDAAELLRHVRPADQQCFIEEVTQALAVAAETKDFRPLQDVLEAWTVTVRLQRQPGYEAMIERMQRRERGVPVDLDKLRRPRG
jgi:Family of unknown function (DUF6247)